MKMRMHVRVAALAVALCPAACGFVKVQTNGASAPGASSTSSTSSDAPSPTSAPASAADSTATATAPSAAATGANDAQSAAPDAHPLVDEIDRALIADTAIAPEKIAALEAKVKASDADGARALSHLLTYYKIEAAWRRDDAAIADTIAAVLGGVAKSNGSVSGKEKPQTVKWRAEADKCYFLFAHLKRGTSEKDRVRR